MNSLKDIFDYVDKIVRINKVPERDIDDLKQESVRRLLNYTGIKVSKAYIASTVHNVCRDYFRELLRLESLKKRIKCKLEHEVMLNLHCTFNTFSMSDVKLSKKDKEFYECLKECRYDILITAVKMGKSLAAVQKRLERLIKKVKNGREIIIN